MLGLEGGGLFNSLNFLCEERILLKRAMRIKMGDLHGCESSSFLTFYKQFSLINKNPRY